MYRLINKNTNLYKTKRQYANIIYETRGIRMINFPPLVGCEAFIFNSISDYWHTTNIQSVEKISDDEYSFTTKNSEYYIKRVSMNSKTKIYNERGIT